jgi:hypothetical protein
VIVQVDWLLAEIERLKNDRTLAYVQRNNARAEMGRLKILLHEVETRCDPAGEARAHVLTRDENAALRIGWCKAEARAEKAEAALRPFAALDISGDEGTEAWDAMIRDARAALRAPSPAECLCYRGWRHCSVHQDDGRDPAEPGEKTCGPGCTRGGE